MSVGYFDGVAPARACLPYNRPTTLMKYCKDPSLGRDVTHACFEAISSTGVEAAHALVAWFWHATTGAGGRHGLTKNAS